MNGIRSFTRRTFGLAAMAWLVAPAAQAQTTLTVSQWLPAGHPVHGVMQDWAQKVEQATQGRVRFKTLPQPVTNPPGHYNAVRDGLAEVAMTVIGYTPGRFPLSEIAELPLMGESAEANSVAFQQLPDDFAVTELWEVLAGSRVGRTSDAQVTVFDSVGFALEDFSALRFMRDSAHALGIGQAIALIPALADPKDLFGALREPHATRLRVVA